ncbi:SDR family oxidoreductase [Aerosakkonema sp. BLCC-F183]|uniref:SDR family oxidoreductase n=1 Tax=Aerosakkonema sp. BLCC-F183 TaxID=3342834 RepID=UPI0035BAB3E7
MSDNFNGKVALVTGASSGLGQATALAFARAGAKVVVACRRRTEGERTVHLIQKEGGEAFFVNTDVSKAVEVEAMVNQTLEKYGRLDCALNNAGVETMGALSDTTEDDWNYVIDINLKGTWLCLKYEISALLKCGGGAIVNVAAIAGVVGMTGLSIYSASKGGIIALTQAAAIEYAGFGIRINTLSPGAIKTEKLEQLPTDVIAQIVAKQPLGRSGHPQEIAEAVLWLCSDKASFITGHNLIVDGGYTAQ